MYKHNVHKQVKYRAGLVGAGYISEYHAAAIRRLRNVELVGVYDVDSPRASAMAIKNGTLSFSSLAALRDAGADVIHVLTPPHAHAAVALEALEMGCHVLVEKPLAVEVEDCHRIRLKARDKGLQVCVNHSLLFDPQIRRALAIVKGGKLGAVRSVDILRSSQYPAYEGGPLPPQYRTAGYPFRDLGVHALYLFEAFLGPIENVHADWTSLGGDPNLAYDEWRAMVRCRDGLGQLQLSWNSRPLQSQLIVHGTKGQLRVDLFLMFHALRASTPLPKAVERIVNAMSDSFQPMVQVPLNVARFALGNLRPYHGLGDLVAEFYRTLEAGEQPPVTAADATAVVEWTERIARVADKSHADCLAGLPPVHRASVLVTGASGALGSAVVNRLQADGRSVRIFVRRVPKDVPKGVEIVVGNLGEASAVARAVAGVDAVIHCGAAMKGGWPEHRGATVVGTQNVLDACRAGGVRKLVHISSLSVVDWAGGKVGQPISENSPLEPRPEARGAYTRAKLQAEQLVGQFCKQHTLPAVILRPGQIFGGAAPLMTPAVARRLGKRWLILGNGKLPLPLVHMDDVVDGIVAALDGPLVSGEIIQLVDRRQLTQNAVLARTDPRAAVIRIPRAVVFALGKLSEFPFRLLGRQSPLSLYRLRSAMACRSFDCRRAEELLGWHPRVGVDRGIRQALGEPARSHSERSSEALVPAGNETAVP
jgi:predicted dehydrogenase/nucleoside-diphosphate-sugar epimerase